VILARVCVRDLLHFSLLEMLYSLCELDKEFSSREAPNIPFFLDNVTVYNNYDKLEPHSSIAFNDTAFADYYSLSYRELVRILRDDYQLEVGYQEFTHLNLALLVLAVSSDDTEYEESIWILLGECLSSSALEIILTSPYVNQDRVDWLMNRVSTKTIKEKSALIEEYGFAPPLGLILPDEIWRKIAASSPREIPIISSLSRRTQTAIEKGEFSVNILKGYARADNVLALNHHERYFKVDTVLELFKTAVGYDSMNVMKYLVSWVKTKISDYDYELRTSVLHEMLEYILTRGREPQVIKKLNFDEAINSYLLLSGPSSRKLQGILDSSWWKR